MFFANDYHPSNAGSIMLGITDEVVEGEWKTFDGEEVRVSEKHILPFLKFHSTLLCKNLIVKRCQTNSIL